MRTFACFDINAIRTKVINRITQGYIDSANSGKAEKESKAQASKNAIYNANNVKSIEFIDGEQLEVTRNKKGDITSAIPYVFPWEKQKLPIDNSKKEENKITLDLDKI